VTEQLLSLNIFLGELVSSDCFFFIYRTDMKSIVLLLAHAAVEQVNSCVSARDLRTPLHLSCAIGNLPIAQLLIWVSHPFFFYLHQRPESCYHLFMFITVKGAPAMKCYFLN
jgi:hypothetical protein